MIGLHLYNIQHQIVSLEAINYGSYNVAIAGSIVMYDRMNKMKKNQKQQNTAE